MRKIIDKQTAMEQYNIPRRVMDRVVHMPGSPAFRFTGDKTSKYWFYEDELEEFLEERLIIRNTVPHPVGRKRAV